MSKDVSNPNIYSFYQSIYLLSTYTHILFCLSRKQMYRTLAVVKLRGISVKSTNCTNNNQGKNMDCGLVRSVKSKDSVAICFLSFKEFVVVVSRKLMVPL